MEYLYALFNDCLYNFVSVFSDPVVLLPVGSAALISITIGLFFWLTRPRSAK